MNLKTTLAAFGATMMFASTASAAVTLRYYNKDSKDYTATAVCSGSKKTVKFGASRTASVTIQGSAPCKVTLNGSSMTFKGDAKIKIEGGKMKGN